MKTRSCTRRRAAEEGEQKRRDDVAQAKNAFRNCSLARVLPVEEHHRNERVPTC